MSFNIIQHQPREINLHIFSYIDSIKDLTSCCLVSKNWNAVANDENLWRDLVLRTIAFGKTKWEKYFGEIGKEPPLPANIVQILKERCPFWDDKKIFQTHALLLIPNKINGNKISLDLLGKIARQPKESAYSSGFYYFYNQTIISKEIDKNYWVLITHDLIPESINLQFQEQKNIIESKQNYSITKIIEAASLIFINYIDSGKLFFQDNLTRCEDEYPNHEKLCIGLFGNDGLYIPLSLNPNQQIGAAAVRRL